MYSQLDCIHFILTMQAYDSMQKINLSGGEVQCKLYFFIVPCSDTVFFYIASQTKCCHNTSDLVHADLVYIK